MGVGIHQGAVRMAGEIGHVGAHGTKQVLADGEQDAGEDTDVQLRGEGQGDDEGDNRCGSVRPGDAPCHQERFDPDQTEHGQNDDDGESGLRQVVEQGRQEEQGGHDDQGADDGGETGCCAGVVIDGGARKGT